MKKQNIEDLFSAIENFSSVPPPELWDKIEKQLDSPKKKKKTALWWLTAACLLLGLLIPSVLRFNSISKVQSGSNGHIENNRVVFEKKEDSQKKIKSPFSEPTNSIQTEKPTKIPTQNKKKQSDGAFINQNKTVATTTNYQKDLFSKKTSDKKHNHTENAKNKYSNAFLNNQTSEAVVNEDLISKNNTDIALNFSDQNKTTKNQSKTKAAVVANPETTPFVQKNNTESPLLPNKKDSLQLAELQNLEQAIGHPKTTKEGNTKTISTTEKWSVGIFAGIANSENYNKNQTLGNVNTSKQSNAYGVKTNYKLNKRWAVSSGIKISELGQSVANISYLNSKNLAFTGTDGHAVQNATRLQISNNSDYIFVAIDHLPNDVTSGSGFESGDIDQRLKYLEMPLGISYSIFSKDKTSISLNTGGFVGKLISNDISLDGKSIGDNTNANDFVYGTLLSSTLQYSLYKKTNVFVEPGMNYYANPLHNQSFNSLQWTFNFGLNISF